MKKISLWLFGAIGIYFLASLWLFNRVYSTTKLVVDEEFHLRQGLHYCHGNFSVWDPKITTFPGLYILSTLILMPLHLCETYFLRMVSLLASILNIYWMYEIRKSILPAKEWKKSPSWGLALDALSVSLLPPMYFFAFLYYTDIASISATLAMFNYSLKNSHKLAATAGSVAVLMRQTNIVWVGFILGLNVLDKLVAKAPRKKSKKDQKFAYSIHDIFNAVRYYLKKLSSGNIKWFLVIIEQFLPYLVVLVAFLVFLYINGSIVIGDKSAHEATIHLAQIGYFSAFVAFFSSGFVLTQFKEIDQILLKRRYILLLLGIFFLLAVEFNSVVHPYLLADNRHYTFYLWNRILAKPLMKYFAIPVFMFGAAWVLEMLEGQSAGFKLGYLVCTAVSVALQSMIEVRYFLIPYLILRLTHTKSFKLNGLAVEFAFNIAINAATFYIFFTKTFFWSNYTEPQRIMW
uniref:Dol-P-Glc:Glc(2)Man(9)GlcNAc(2)-PP-Dol alpha-1,2-glucosyltransferase n=1 Tax=Lutzomyia longipalpis TaxID=7200 RepID=A0A7G3AAW1_LUTLO